MQYVEVPSQRAGAHASLAVPMLIQMIRGLGPERGGVGRWTHSLVPGRGGLECSDEPPALRILLAGEQQFYMGMHEPETTVDVKH